MHWHAGILRSSASRELILHCLTSISKTRLTMKPFQPITPINTWRMVPWNLPVREYWAVMYSFTHSLTHVLFVSPSPGILSCPFNEWGSCRVVYKKANGVRTRAETWHIWLKGPISRRLELKVLNKWVLQKQTNKNKCLTEVLRNIFILTLRVPIHLWDAPPTT